MDLNYQIPRLALLWVISCVLLVILPHVLRLPLWITLLTLLCMGWRLLIHGGRAGYPGKLIKLLIVLTAIPLTIIQYRTQGAGLDAAVCLLILGVVFKLLEMQYRRDIVIVIALTYILTMVGFIYSQTIPASLYALLVFTAITGALVSLNRDNMRNSAAGNARLAARLVLQSIPFTIVLFVLVPRIAPLWTMPVPVSSAKTGVTDEMTPGNITNLGRSAELAFRVTFAGQAPTHEQLYWRGLVLDNFDGTTWRRTNSSFQSFGIVSRFRPEFLGVKQGAAVAYDVILEPTQQTWLYGLQLAEFESSEIVQDRNYTLHTATPISQRLRYQMSSYLQHQTDLRLPGNLRARVLQLPQNDLNERSLELAQDLRDASISDRDYAARVMGMFREQPFYYTLNPPALGGASIDEFLFDTREGFCSHYAGSFVYLMRAVGIPARVVVGYQGGEYNRFEDYTMVYQYNAHAWTEVWFEGEGWVQFDPTGAVAPERISLGVEAVFADQPGFMEDSGFSMMRFRNNQLLNTLRLRLDALDYAWNRFVVSYDEDLQLALFEDALGQNARSGLFWALGASSALLFAIAAFFLLRGGRSVVRDPATRLFLALTKDLQELGHGRHRGEGPQDYCTRICLERPDLARDMRTVTTLYMQISYADAAVSDSAGSDATLAASKVMSQKEMLQEFKIRLRNFRLRLLSRSKRTGLMLTGLGRTR